MAYEKIRLILLSIWSNLSLYVLLFDVSSIKNWLAFIKNEIVMKMENMNIPPNPYKCNVRLPVRSINGIDAKVITTYGWDKKNYLYWMRVLGRKNELENVRTIIAPIPIVANLAFSSVRPALVNKNVE